MWDFVEVWSRKILSCEIIVASTSNLKWQRFPGQSGNFFATRWPVLSCPARKLSKIGFLFWFVKRKKFVQKNPSKQSFTMRITCETSVFNRTQPGVTRKFQKSTLAIGKKDENSKLFLILMTAKNKTGERYSKKDLMSIFSGNLLQYSTYRYHRKSHESPQ